ncbi:MAG TPA: DUF1365 domain-containing protein [Solirubrobacteraceae bacterium]|jgi:DUF1365 family protein|nr:DUF1365 domain-containing protein [Solirubrobacteraceae bacterium]
MHTSSARNDQAFCGYDAAAGALAAVPARASSTASALYRGSVRHRRFDVRAREFRYRLALAYIDLDELPALLGGKLVASRPGPARFRRRHYLGDEYVPLADAVRELVSAQAGLRPSGPIRLLTNLSSFGHCFNPVSFYYCMDAAAESVEAVVAEVTNTPWGERHAYVLARGREDCSPAGAVLAGNSTKALHVSPFMGMDQRYEWRASVPGETLSVHIASSRKGDLTFDATLSLRRQELTRATLARMSARYPASALRMLAMIYAQAARLKLNGVPVHPHPRQGLA